MKKKEPGCVVPIDFKSLSLWSSNSFPRPSPNGVKTTHYSSGEAHFIFILFLFSGHVSR
jgi:hypothetical protein